MSTPARVLCVGALLILLVRIASSVDAMQVQIEGMRGTNWRSGPISIDLDLSEADELSFVANAAQLRLPAPFEKARVARLHCPRAQQVDGRWQCANASVQVGFSDQDSWRFQATVAIDAAKGAVSIEAKEQSFVGGVLGFVLHSRGDSVDVDARFSKLALATLQQLAALFGTSLSLTASAGELSGEIRIKEVGRVRVVQARLQLDNGAFADASGSQAAEGLRFETRFDARSDPRQGLAEWQFDSSSSLQAGVVYVAPLLLDVSASNKDGEGPITMQMSGRYSQDGRVQIDNLAFRDPDMLRFDASVQLTTEPQLEVQRFSITAPEQPVTAVYERYLKPFAGAGIAAQLSLDGVLSARVEGAWSAQGVSNIVSGLRLTDIDIGDSHGRFSILGLGGELNWRSDEEKRDARLDSSPPSGTGGGALDLPSTVRWQSVQLRALGLGGGTLRLALRGRSVDLLEPLNVDLLDGAVQVERLKGRAVGTEQQHVEMQLSLSPISLQRLSERLAWLPLSGSIAGQIPKLTLTAQSLRVADDVNMDLFDGTVRIENLRVLRPFSALSQLHADVFVEGIDLGVLSRAFSFGQVEGRLDGSARGLVLESWQPVAFDAVLGTPQGDTSRRRISQRAVDNLASLGGAQAVLSTTFLRFFEEFSYARLGLSCRLQRGVCEMGGVAPAAQGYYIVEGGGLPPRVDVVGFNRRVDWHTLLDRLKAVTASEGPIIR